MKIGIMTFHWATNYGAILQSYALQRTLQEMGHEVDIINYKPLHFDHSPWSFIRSRAFLHPRAFLNGVKKERRMIPFRKKYLHCTKRYVSIKKLQQECKEYDVLISGSDQVMNPSFLTFGEKGGSTAYFLDFGRDDAIRLTYAVSFGTTEYPANLIPRVTRLVRRFRALSVRENTGSNIFSAMGRTDAAVVPDPTLLLQSADYDRAFNLSSEPSGGTLVYMLHNRGSAIQKRLSGNRITAITHESVEEWIQAIKNSEYVITNSFHGMVFAILCHVPFTVVLTSIRNEGMNDRFFTLLERLGLSDRIMSEEDFCINRTPIDWDNVNHHLSALREEGMSFLKCSMLER